MIVWSESCRLSSLNGEPVVELQGTLARPDGSVISAVSGYWPKRPAAVADKARAIRDVEEVLEKMRNINRVIVTGRVSC